MTRSEKWKRIGEINLKLRELEDERARHFRQQSDNLPF